MYCWRVWNEFCCKWKILTNTNFKQIYIQPAAGDAGGALGSALRTYKIKSENPKKFL